MSVRARYIGALIGAWEQGRRAALAQRPLLLSDKGRRAPHAYVWVRMGYHYTQQHTEQLTLFKARRRA